MTLLLTNAVSKVLLGEDESMLNIVDDDFAPGQFILRRHRLRCVKMLVSPR